LRNYYDIQFYDSRKLAEISTSGKAKSVIHNQFKEEGITNAVKNLLLMSIHSPVTVLAFSIGGTIAWKASLAGFPIKKLVAVSVTRLRLEKARPACELVLFYGNKDQFLPSQEWFLKHGLESAKNIMEGEHEMYRLSSSAKVICTSLTHT